MKLSVWNCLGSFARLGFSGGGWTGPGAGGIEERVRYGQSPLGGTAGLGRVWEVALDARHRTVLYKQAVGAPSPVAEPQAFLGHCRHLAGYLPDSIVMALTLFRGDSGAPGTLLLRGLPQDPDPSKPGPIPGKPLAERVVAEAVLGALACVLGVPDAVGGRQNSAAAEDLILKRDRYPDASRPRGLWTAAAYRAIPPSFLLYLRADGDQQRTLSIDVAAATDALDMLAGEEAMLLRQPLFRMAESCESDAAGIRRTWSCPHPLLWDEAGSLHTRLGGAGIMAVSQEADAALRAYRAALVTATQPVRLLPGDVLVINNRKAVHGLIVPAGGSNAGPVGRVLRRRVMATGHVRGD